MSPKEQAVDGEAGNMANASVSIKMHIVGEITNAPAPHSYLSSDRSEQYPKPTPVYIVVWSDRWISSLLLQIRFYFAGSETMPGDGFAGSGCTRVVPIVPVRPLPVVPGGRVRAPKGTLSGDCGTLLLELGEGGLWVAPCAKDDAVPARRTATPKPSLIMMFILDLVEQFYSVEAAALKRLHGLSVKRWSPKHTFIFVAAVCPCHSGRSVSA